ncbi:DNA primase [uncultured Negativibacillus sp.]|uniref:DNA primase n=1 Tax=uncultured Negativibacillus sp. TaxID=1980696 RepID=UPI0025CF2D91|nr:DNA primase [uncultured Negativibacillus sp.]
MLSESFIQQLKQYSDIEHIVSGYVQLKKKGRYLSGLCPFHSEKSPSFFVYPQTQSFYCFGCGAGGDVITFIRQIENLEYMEAVRFLADRCGMTVPQDSEDDGRARLKKRVLEINRETARYFHDCLMSEQGKDAYAYLIRRGRDRKTIRHFGLGYAPDSWHGLVEHLRTKGFSEKEMIEANVAVQSQKGGAYDRFRNRVMFPIIDVRGNVIAFGGRALDDKGAKYLNSSDTIVFKKSKNLFALNFAKTSKLPGLILAEGYMDVIAIHQAGFDNAVATLGTSLTEEQARLISQYADKVVLAYDSDGPGQAATKRALNIFDEVGVKVTVLSMTGAKDPDEYIQKYGRERFAMLIDGSRNAIEFELSRLRNNHDVQTADGKVNFLKEACKLFAGIRNPVEREVYITQVANELEISPQAIKAQIQSLDKREQSRQRRQQKADTNIYIGRMAAAKNDVSRQVNLRYAMAEEGILYCLMKNPDFYQTVREKIAPEDFVTEVNRELYTAMVKRLESGQPIEMLDLSSELSPQAMGRVSAILATAPVQRCDLAELDDYIQRLSEHRNVKTEKEVAQMDDDALEAYVKQLAAKKNRRS